MFRVTYLDKMGRKHSKEVKQKELLAGVIITLLKEGSTQVKIKEVK